MIIWFTGQPGHGKTVLADRFAKYVLETTKQKVFRVDGDDLRALTSNVDYSKEGRIKNIKSAQDIALYLHNQGYMVAVSLVSPYKDQREEFKNFVGKENITEVYVHTHRPRERDHFHVKEYEAPTENFLNIDTSDEHPDQSLQRIVKFLFG